MNRFVLGVLCILFLFTMIGCGAPAPVHENQEPATYTYVEKGDMSYIPINKDGLPEANLDEIFQAVSAWQENHPDREIVDIDYLYMQNTYSSYTKNYTYGVSILSHQKTSAM